MKLKGILNFVQRVNNYLPDKLNFDFFRRVISLCEKNNKFLRISEYETSIPFKGPLYPRFVHYILYKKSLQKNRNLGSLFAFRGLDILKYCGLNDGYYVLKSFINILREKEISIPYTIVSVEFEKNRIKKFSEYFCFRKIDKKLAQILSDFIGFDKPEFIYENSRNITFIGIDYFPENNEILLKLYNKWKFNKKLLYGYERKFLEKYNLNYVKDLVRTTYIYPDGRFELNKKTHFIFNRKQKFFEFLKMPLSKITGPVLKLGVLDKNKIVISIDKNAFPLEIYIK